MPNPTPLQNLTDIAKICSDRAEGLRKMANGVLWAIVSVIVAGIAVFSLAYRLSNVGSSLKVDELTNRLSSLQVSISDDFKSMNIAATSLIGALEAGGCGKRGSDTSWLYSINDEQIASDFGEKTLKEIASDGRFDNFNLYVSIRSQWVSANEKPMVVPTERLYVNKNEVGKCIVVLQRADSAKEIAKNAKLANSHIADYASTWRVMEAAYGEADKRNLAKIEDYLTTQSWYSVIHTNVTRIGSLVMIIFLVTILAPLYRYCLRLAAFYDARSDAMLLAHAQMTTSRFVELAAAMTPALDFGSPPPTPIDQFIALVREIRGSAKSDKTTKDEKGE
jgi:hypothetical protein